MTAVTVALVGMSKIVADNGHVPVAMLAIDRESHQGVAIGAPNLSGVNIEDFICAMADAIKENRK